MTHHKLEKTPGLKVSVAVSREWNGKTVASEIIGKINVKVQKPKFILLFTTIHYKDDFKLILSGIKDAFPDSPLIGGTVAGFMCPEGCFTRGVTAFALDYPNMDVCLGVGRHTKRNPKKAARECADMIKEGLKKNKYETKFLINLISAPLIPELPLVGKVNNVKSNILGMILSYIGMPLVSYLGSGIAKESDILDQLALSLPEFHIIGGSSVDDGRMISNYQFIENEIYTNAIVAIGCATDKEVYQENCAMVHETDKKFKITGTAYNDRIITSIENKPAKEYFFENVLGFSEKLFKNLGAFYYKTSDYFPLTFEENKERILGVGCFFGENILLSHKMGGKHAILCSVRGKEIITNMSTVFNNDEKNYPFILAFSSIIHVFILGKNIFDIKILLDRKLGDTPYLVLQPMIENTRTPPQKPIIRAYSFNALTLK